ncbi:MAG: hypothetical protein R2701_07055 [Acidimicrobiales bacterium]|nr:hypothetical protein [Acidimicrobiales bacterium]
MAHPFALRVLLRRPAAVAATLLVAALGTLGLAGCGDSDGGPAARAERTQAVERLQDYGLSDDQASCVVDALGAETIVEATDLNAFTEGQDYRDAADRCTADG